ncbi:EAL domain-containing protein [Micromonospora sp. CPCC 205371]|nr:EAL domain-containing protein [Micromonospora sp. CPCC 205371]
MSARKIMVGYGLWMSVLAVGVFALPALHLHLWAAVGVSSTVAIVYGVVRHRPRRRLPWSLLAAGIAVFTAGDLVFNANPQSVPFLADVLYLSVFPLVAAGYWGFTRSSTTIRERSGLLDLLVFVSAGALLFWVLLVGPQLTGASRDPFDKSVAAAYALGNLLVLATTLRLLVVSRRAVSATLLTVGAAGLLAADVVYAGAEMEGGWQNGQPAELGWLLFYAAWGAAALHPSMVRLTAPVDARHGDVSRVWMVLLGLAALVGPGVLLVQAMSGDVRDGAVIAVCSAMVFWLVLSRLTDSMEAHRRSVARERALRQAAGSMVSATRVAEVDRAVRMAVGQLIPPETGYRVVFAVHHADGIPTTAVSIWGPAVASLVGSPAVAARRVKLLRVRGLHPALAEQLGGFESAVLCPLVLDVRSAGVHWVGALLVAAEGGVLSTMRDSLEVLAAEAALALERITLNDEIDRRNSEEYFRTLVQSTADVILIVGDDDQIRYASPSTATVLGVDPAKCTTLDAVIHPHDQAAVRRTLDLARSGQEPANEWTPWGLRRPDDSRVQVEVSCRDLRADRTVRGLVITMRDVTARRQLERELSHSALHDALTGLPNRALFQDRVRHAVAHPATDGGRVAVLLIDLDDFTMVNEVSGHAIGDELLAAVGARLSTVLGRRGMVARVGGDEFAAVVDAVADPETAEQVATEVQAVLAEPFQLGEDGERGRVLVSAPASVGVATTADAATADELFRQADLALRLAKGAGRGQWRRYEATLHAAVLQRLELRAALDRAAADQDFTLEYQPIVEMASGRTVGFEALVRWRHPALGLVPPDEFIDIAEETGLIEAIGDFVLRQAVGAASRWAKQDGTQPYVSVNVSARQFRAPGFITRVRQELADAGLPPSALMLEITERLLLRDDEQVWHDLTCLREHGVRIAIDDFGTGFSSLSYLRQVPIDVLKIDKSFTATVASSARQQAIVDGIVRLAQTLQLDAIAEGIETAADRDLLCDLNCPYGQGFLYSKPLRLDGAVEWLRFERDATGAEIAAISSRP